MSDTRAALVELEAAATAVNRCGTRRGPQWLRLSVALLRARVALDESHVRLLTDLHRFEGQHNPPSLEHGINGDTTP